MKSTQGVIYLSRLVSLGLIALFFFEVTTFRFLFADGVVTFFYMVTRERVFTSYASRYLANVLLDSPTMFLHRWVGINNLKVLGIVFGASLYSHYFVSLWVCWRIVKKTRPWLFLFPVLSYLSATLNSSMFITSEAHVAVSLFWPLFLFFLVREQFLILELLLAALACLFFTKIYEGAVVFQLILLGILILKRRTWGALPKKQAALVALCALSLIAGGLLNVNWTLRFPSLVNRNDFLSNAHLFWFWRDPPLFLSVFNVIAICFSLQIAQSTGPLMQNAKRLLYFLSLGLSVALAFILVASPQYSRPELHHTARVLLIQLPAVLSLFTLWCFRRAEPAFGVAREGSEESSAEGGNWPRYLLVYRQTALFCLAAIACQITLTQYWSNFVDGYHDILDKNVGVVQYDKSELLRLKKNGVDLSGFLFGWNYPFMSIILSGFKQREVRCVIKNPKIIFADLDLASHKTVPSLEKYGVVYNW